MSYTNEYFSRRKQDEKLEQTLHPYFDAMYVHAELPMERVIDPELQKKGVDLRNPNGSELYDEKAAIHYSTKNLKTFCIELTTDNNKNQLGWFINPESLTTHYNFVWLKADDNNLNHLYFLEMAIVPKEELKTYLHAVGIDSVDTVKKYFADGKATRIRYGNERYFYNPDVSFFWSHSLAENPLNILISKNKLIRLSSYYLTMTEEDIREVDKRRLA